MSFEFSNSDEKQLQFGVHLSLFLVKVVFNFLLRNINIGSPRFDPAETFVVIVKPSDPSLL